MFKMRGFFGELGWGWRLMLGTLALCAVTKIGCMTAKTVTTDYSSYTSSRLPETAVRNTRNIVGAALGENEELAALRVENQRLTGLVNDRTATCEQITARETRAGQPNAINAARQLASCQMEKNTLEQTRLTRDACNAEMVSYYNNHCVGGRIQLQPAPR